MTKMRKYNLVTAHSRVANSIIASLLSCVLCEHAQCAPETHAVPAKAPNEAVMRLDASRDFYLHPGQAQQGSDLFTSYMLALQRRIKRAWFPPKRYESKRVIVLFKIHQGGELSDLHVKQSSGDGIADKAALEAIERAAPFIPLPAGADTVVDIQYTFEHPESSAPTSLRQR